MKIDETKLPSKFTKIITNVAVLLISLKNPWKNSTLLTLASANYLIFYFIIVKLIHITGII